MKKLSLLHPIVFALYPLLFLYAHNIDEVLPRILAMPIALSLFMAVFAFGFFYLLTKQVHKAALAASITVVAFFLFAAFQDGLAFITRYGTLSLGLFFFLSLPWLYRNMYKENTGNKDIARLISLIVAVGGLFVFHVFTSFIIGSGFSSFKILSLVLLAMLFFMAVFLVPSLVVPFFVSRQLEAKRFLTMLLLTVFMYFLVIQTGTFGVRHAVLFPVMLAWIVLVLLAVRLSSKHKWMRNLLIFISVFQIFALFVMINLDFDMLVYNFLAELVYFIVYVILTGLVLNVKTVKSEINVVLWVVALALISGPLYSIFVYDGGKSDGEAVRISCDASIGDTTERLPVYYLVLDEYASSQVVEELFFYDNAWFEDSLRSLGFSAGEWLTTSEHTHEVIACVLNVGAHNQGQGARRNFGAIKDNAVTHFFKEEGYAIVQYPVWRYEQFVMINNSDTLVSIPKSGIKAKLGDFYSKVLYMGMLRRYIAQDVSFYRNAVNYVFETLPTINELYPDKPFFVYAHVLSPHAPFVFDKDGGVIGIMHNGNRYYTGQYEYISKCVLRTVKALLDVHNGQCIIVVQSDHGPREGETGIATTESQRKRIFNAMYFPDKSFNVPDAEYAVNSNTFALVINYLFGCDLKYHDVPAK